MKLLRFGPVGQEAPGLQLAENRRIDARGFGSDWNEEFFANDGLERLAHWAATHAAAAPTLAPETRLGACIARPSKIICIGLNYRDHAAETHAKLPVEPVIFFKSTTALCGPDDPVVIPLGGTKLDWEVELAVVMGRTARHVNESDALAHVAGYCLHNDYSERAFQLEHCGQWVKGKSCDTFAPLGPFLATRDEVPDPQALELWLRVNGVEQQRSNTREMSFGVASLVSYISHFMTLLPGDVISTGTPAGVGLAKDPPQYLQAGDLVELGIDKLGRSQQRVVPHPDMR
ncbi:MAG: FAA hydrolase family protein [Planctomycetes bacterium]|nr:FAA hydrolase family protein [Planctomycetota bacterium]